MNHFCFISLVYITVWIFITATLQTKQHNLLNLCQVTFCEENSVGVEIILSGSFFEDEQVSRILPVFILQLLRKRYERKLIY